MNVPAVVKVRLTLAFCVSPMLDGAPVVPANETLCASEPENVQVTVPPVEISTCCGVKLLLASAVTLAAAEMMICCTVRARLPVLPEIVAVIVAAPLATPVTSPDAFTVATAVADEDQLVASPGSVVPAAFFAAADS